jgi:hypothetical protein
MKGVEKIGKRGGQNRDRGDGILETIEIVPYIYINIQIGRGDLVTGSEEVG